MTRRPATDLDDGYQLFELKQAAYTLADAIGRARTATAMHWTADHARHLETARRLVRSLGESLGTA